MINSEKFIHRIGHPLPGGFSCQGGNARPEVVFLPDKIVLEQLSDRDEARITYFPEDVIKDIPLPERFTFPFYYEPHPLARLAATELQQYLQAQTVIDHNFGLEGNKEGLVIGKMFGVLVVSDAGGRIGYLSAFSGKLGNANYHEGFVPPVFDMLADDGFFAPGIVVIDAINDKIDELQISDEYLDAKTRLGDVEARAQQELSEMRQQHKANKENRRLRREALHGVDVQIDEGVLAGLLKESHYDQYLYKVLKERWKAETAKAQEEWDRVNGRLEAMKLERKERSAALQNQLFEQYSFLNEAGKRKSLQDIFSTTAFGKPPAGAGECATPKLLQYAFANGYKPRAFAEFWWGASPPSEIRQHKQFYPACAGKCKPILAHMLEGIALDENPFLQPAKEEVEIKIVYEDEWLAVVDKPAELRSVPGVNIADSVYSRLKILWGGEEPFMVHRLDMGTSGLLVVARTQEVHKRLQKQFLDRTVKKRYTALLCREIEGEEGEVNLPLRADPFNRPAQVVCFEAGKKSITLWKAVEKTTGTTRVHFWPLTGRTHQLRMHSAHELGLNAPIVGDDVYGTAADRLYLHAASLSFIHPITRERVTFELKEDF